MRGCRRRTMTSRTQGLDRLELIRFLQVAQTLTVHHGALAYLLGINALRASEAAAVMIEDYRETLRGHRVLHLVGRGPQACHHAAHRPRDPRPRSMPGRTDARTARAPTTVRKADRPPRLLPHGRPDRQGCRHPPPRDPALATTRRDHQRPRRGSPFAGPGTPTHAPRSTTTAPAATSTATASTSSPPTSPASEPVAQPGHRTVRVQTQAQPRHPFLADLRPGRLALTVGGRRPSDVRSR
jgi:integrase/recombinase XerD